MRKLILLLLVGMSLTACNLDTSTIGNPTQQATAIDQQPTTVVVQPTQVIDSPTQIVVQPTQVVVQATSEPLPTHTPSTGGEQPETEATVPVPVTSSDGCQAVASASGITVSAQQERAEAPRTLPNGEAFPNVDPVPIVSASSARMSTFGAPSTTALLIQFTPDSNTADRVAYVTSISGIIDTQLDAIHTYFVTVEGAFDVSTAPRSPIVVGIEFDGVASATQADEPTPPNDPRYGEQWAFPVVGLPEAWDSLPSRTVIVAVIDSGVCLSHPDLQGRIVGGYDFVDGDNDPSDVYGHGCGVAGVIAANSNNGIGISGIAPNVNIMPLRVLDGSGLGNYSNIANAIIYAADNGADIINLSLAGQTSSAILEASIAYAIERGVVVIAAAGNFSSDRTFYPAAYPSVIAVGSVDVNLNRSSFSNFGPDVDVYAPGRDILTTNMLGDYQFQSGTSFAAPIVAGITAMSETMNTPLNTEDGIVFIYPPDALPDC